MRHIMLLGFIAAFLLLPGIGLAAESNATQQPFSVSPEVLFADQHLNAEKGQARAMLNVGIFYEQGIGVPRNFTKALEWYQKAALAGEREAHLRTGACFEIGMGTAVDMDKAVTHYDKAAQMGLPEAQYKMASLYLTGNGVAKDAAKGFGLLTSAAESGHGAAANELAVVYMQGLLGQLKDPVKAREWFLKSAETGHLEGIKNFAVALKDGVGQKADPAAALRWYLTAYKGGLRSPDIDGIIADLKKKLTAAQINKAEAEADKWLADLAARARPK